MAVATFWGPRAELARDIYLEGLQVTRASQHTREWTTITNGIPEKWEADEDGNIYNAPLNDYTVCQLPVIDATEAEIEELLSGQTHGNPNVFAYAVTRDGRVLGPANGEVF